MHSVWKTAMVIAGSATLVGLAQSTTPRTVWDGVFTEAQALRGQSGYEVSCASCHQVDLSGGVLVGDDEAPPLRSVERLVERGDVGALLTFVRNGMPADAPATLTDAAYLDIVAYLLYENGFPAGTAELKADPGALKSISIVRKPQ